MMRHVTKTTPQLATGDVVYAYGARLRLTEPVINAVRARALAEADRLLSLPHAHTDAARARVETRFQGALQLRSFRTEVLHAGAGCNLPPNWILQGNANRCWDVEAP